MDLAFDPLHVLGCPRSDFGGRPLSLAEQKFAQSLTSALLVRFCCFACADQITKSFVCFVRNPHRCQISSTMTSRQLLTIAAVRLDAITSFGGHQRGCHNLAV